MRLTNLLLGLGPLITLVDSHLAAWHKGMYCLNGTNPDSPDFNTASPVTPLYQLSKKDWWFHHINGCDNFPPSKGDFLELPAGGSFTVEIASNRGETSLSFNGRFTSAWANGQDYPDNYNVPSCITSPNMHTQNQSMAAGTAFAISYNSDITKVTPENLAVFTVRYHTPWKRLTTYDVPAKLPACPPAGCTCAWGWIPNGCGQPNMYHQAFKCKVLNAKSVAPVAAPKAPVWCEDDQSKCVKGSKQMLYWNQLEGNNIFVEGYDLAGSHKSPGYNQKCGFADGAQNDIFIQSPAEGGHPTTPPVAAPTPSKAPGKVAGQPNGTTPYSAGSNGGATRKCRSKKSRDLSASNSQPDAINEASFAGHRRMMRRIWSE